MRFTEHLTITSFGTHLDNTVLGEQTKLTPFGHGLDSTLREMAVTLWYDTGTKPINPDPGGWLAFQLVQPKLEFSEVRAYPDGYAVIAQSARVPFRDIVEFGVIRVRGQGGSIRYLEPLYIVAQGYNSDLSFESVWEGLSTATITLHYKEAVDDAYERSGTESQPTRPIKDLRR